MAPTFRLADQVVCRQTNSDLRMLFDRRKGVMYELNETASAVVEQLDRRPMALDGLVEVLLADFDAPVDEIREDIERLLAEFSEAGILVQEVSESASHGT